jgi:ribosomal protein L11 methyltransferase
MFSVELHCQPEVKDLMIAELWERGCAGITELSDSHLRAFFHADTGDLRDALAGYHPVWEQVEEQDWVRIAHARLEPMLVGARFFLVPVWRDDPTPPGRLRITVNPGMAFGTGAHETTQLCIEALERHIRPGATVLDVGTGSGILSIAAKMLGAAGVVACDNDPDAIAAARLHAPAYLGSVDAAASASIDVLVVNIGPAAVVEMAPDIRRCLRPNGIALVSGFEQADTARVEQAYPGATLFAKGEWRLLEKRY